MIWWSRTLGLLFAVGWLALVVAFIWVLWADGTQFVDLGDLEFRFNFSGGDLERVLATIVAVVLGLAALLFIANRALGLGERRRYHQMLRQDGTQLLVDTSIVSQRLADAARTVPGVRKVRASARPASNNEVHAGLDLEVYGDADPAVTAQQASRAAVEVLQRDFETRPAGGLKTQVRQRGKAGPKRPAGPRPTEPESQPVTTVSQTERTEPVPAEATSSEPEGTTDAAPEVPPVHEGEDEESEP